MIWSNPTESPAVEQVLRRGTLEALSQSPRPTRDVGDTASPPATTAISESEWPVDLLEFHAIETSQIKGTREDNRSIAADRILAARQSEDVVAALSFAGLRSAADRIKYLHRVTLDHGSGEPRIVLPSLRELALFLLTQQQLADPDIGLSPDGLLSAEWNSSERGIVAMIFLPGGRIQFAAVSAARGTGRSIRVSGVLPKDEVLLAVRRFSPGGAV